MKKCARVEIFLFANSNGNQIAGRDLRSAYATEKKTLQLHRIKIKWIMYIFTEIGNKNRIRRVRI